MVFGVARYWSSNNYCTVYKICLSILVYVLEQIETWSIGPCCFLLCINGSTQSTPCFHHSDEQSHQNYVNIPYCKWWLIFASYPSNVKKYKIFYINPMTVEVFHRISFNLMIKKIVQQILMSNLILQGFL